MARRAKRIIDIGGALIGLIAFAPAMAAIAVAIRATMGRPVLFGQLRPGYRARPFTLLKFRTMSGSDQVDGRPVPDERRLTPLGRLLRRTSLDELPQLWNVLGGDLSLVGPRPLLMEYLPLYTPEQMRRHDVPPGITGLAQINGRNAITWEEKFALDVWYVDHWSLRLDLTILLRTLERVARRQGVSAPGQATVARFSPHGESHGDSS